MGKESRDKDFFMFWLWQYTKRANLTVEKGFTYFVLGNSCLQFFINNALDILTPDEKYDADRLLDNWLSNSFTYEYPEITGGFDQIILLSPDMLKDEKEPIFYENGYPVYDNTKFHIKNYYHLIAVNKKADIDVVIAEIRGLMKDDYNQKMISFIKNQSNFRRNTAQMIENNIPRLIGLWFWDYVNIKHKKKPSISSTTKAFESIPGIEKLTKEKELDYYHYYRTTDQCIKQLKVLSFSKRKSIKQGNKGAGSLEPNS